MTIATSEVVELLTTLIKNRCVNDGTADSGGERRSVDTLASYFGQRGTEFERHPGRVSTLYRVPGSDAAAPSLMLMGHLDVVPVSEAGWTHDPFGGEVIDGFVWGRGAVDMLNQTSTMAAVFRRYLLGEVPPLAGDLIFFAVADEEAGGVLGAKWIAEEHWDQVACDYLLTEIGTPALPGERSVGLPVTVAEKGPQWRRLRSRGQPGHASQPYAAANALTPIARAVSRLNDFPPGPFITPEWKAFVEAWAPSPDLRADLIDPDRVGDAIDRIAIDDLGLARWIHACTHMTVSANTLHSGVKANVIPDSAVSEIDVRILPGQDEADVLDHFRKVIGPELEEIELEVIQANPASVSAPAGQLWDAIVDAMAQVAPGIGLIPAMIPVGTDARFFRRHGTIAYGLGLFDDRVSFGDFLRMFHGHDERVSVESLRLTTTLYEKVVAQFGGG